MTKKDQVLKGGSRARSEGRSARPLPRQINVYEKIVRAAKLGKGLRLSVDEVFELSLDSGIIEAAFQYIGKSELAEAERERKAIDAMEFKPQ